MIEMKTRDMTKAEFDAACERNGFKPCGFLGYYDVGFGYSVSVLNAGENRRERIAYLIRERERVEAKYADKQKAAS